MRRHTDASSARSCRIFAKRFDVAEILVAPHRAWDAMSGERVRANHKKSCVDRDQRRDEIDEVGIHVSVRCPVRACAPASQHVRSSASLDPRASTPPTSASRRVPRAPMPSWQRSGPRRVRCAGAVTKLRRMTRRSIASLRPPYRRCVRPFNALAECVIGLYKTEVRFSRGARRSFSLRRVSQQAVVDVEHKSMCCDRYVSTQTYRRNHCLT